jgi:hypothetical protein
MLAERKSNDMTGNGTNQPVVSQRCHCAGIGFGTIREIRGNRLKIRFDADNSWMDEEKTRWKRLDEVELVALPVVQDSDPLAPGYPEPSDDVAWDQ